MDQPQNIFQAQKMVWKFTFHPVTVRCNGFLSLESTHLISISTASNLQLVGYVYEITSHTSHWHVKKELNIEFRCIKKNASQTNTAGVFITSTHPLYQTPQNEAWPCTYTLPTFPDLISNFLQCPCIHKHIFRVYSKKKIHSMFIKRCIFSESAMGT